MEKNRKTRMSPSTCVFVLTVLALSSCWYNHKWEDMHPQPPTPAGCDSAGVVSYATTIAPIVQQNCTNASGCHGSNGMSSNYTTWNNFKTDAQNGKVMTRIRLPLSNPLHMPIGGNLLQCDTIKLKKWIMNGCLNN